MKKYFYTCIALVFLFSINSKFAQDSNQKLSSVQNGGNLKINLTSVVVEDQEKALVFYTEVLGFIKKNEIPLGKYKWLTVVSPQDTNGTELLLEPNDNPAAKTFQKSLFDQGIPIAMFGTDDIDSEFSRLNELGVEFVMKPTDVGTAVIAIFNDTCGNLIQIAQVK